MNYSVYLKKLLKYFFTICFLLICITFLIGISINIHFKYQNYIFETENKKKYKQYKQAFDNVDFIVKKMQKKELIELLKCTNSQDFDFIYNFILSAKHCYTKYIENKDILKISVITLDSKGSSEYGDLDLEEYSTSLDFYFINIKGKWKLLSLYKKNISDNNMVNKCKIVQKYNL